jgi:uncharacterized protein (DUF58 family)
MIPKEILKKIRRIEITTSRLVTDTFAGQYHSVFKGRGIEFDEVREYQVGDDIRAIDWNVTARTGSPHIKKYIEEREMTVMILVDASASCRFASVNMLKSQLAAEISSVLTFSAIRNNDKVGMIIFTDRVEKFIPPRKGLKHVLRMIREVLYFEPQGISTDIPGALEYLNNITTRKSVAFLISDFMDINSSQKKYQELLKRKLSVTNKRHDLIAVTLNDPKEFELPSCGLLTLQDAETKEIFTVDSSDEAFRQAYHLRNKERFSVREQIFKSVGMDFINLSTEGSYADELVKFFYKRRRRNRL